MVKNCANGPNSFLSWLLNIMFSSLKTSICFSCRIIWDIISLHVFSSSSNRLSSWNIEILWNQFYSLHWSQLLTVQWYNLHNSYYTKRQQQFRPPSSVPWFPISNGNTLLCTFQALTSWLKNTWIEGNPLTLLFSSLPWAPKLVRSSTVV